MKYYVPSIGETVADARRFHATEWVHPKGSIQFAAEQAAGDFWWCQHGCDRDWPLEFVILSDDGSELCTASVDMEAVPSFTATKVSKTP